MSSPALIKQADVRRIVQGLKDAGEQIAEIKYEDGVVRVIVGSPKEKQETMDATDW